MEYKVELNKIENKNYLIFFVDNDELKIDLNSSEQSALRDLFYKIINKLFEHKVNFNLEIHDGYSEMLYIDIAKDYIKKLNDEIDKVYNNMPEELKNNND